MKNHREKNYEIDFNSWDKQYSCSMGITHFLEINQCECASCSNEKIMYTSQSNKKGVNLIFLSRTVVLLITCKKYFISFYFYQNEYYNVSPLALSL